MNQITTPPTEPQKFGLQFNYAAWVPDTIIDILNVAWNNDYRDVVKFPTPAARDAYIDSRQPYGIHIEKASYIKPDRSVVLDVPFNVATKYNYLRAKNPLQPIAGDTLRNYYYFITAVEYINPQATRFVLQLDIFTTYQFDFTFGQCYIEHGHIGIANTKAGQNYGRDYLTIPDGLDVGAEYQVVGVANKKIMGNGTGSADPYNILVVSAVDLQADPGSVDTPNYVTAGGGQFLGLVSGANYYLWKSPDDFRTWLSSMSQKPWVTQSILSINMVPPMDNYNMGVAAGSAPKLVGGSATGNRSYSLWSDWRDSAAVNNHIPDRYKVLKAKLLTFPYTVVELTTFSGTPIILKPESWNDDDGTVREFTNFAPPGARIAVTPFHYNSVGQSINNRDDLGDFLDVATYIQNLPSLMIVNNGAIAYLAANHNQIAFSYQNADWSQQKALRSNQVSYDQASSAMNLQQELTNIGINTDVATTTQANGMIQSKATLNTIASVFGGGVAGVGGGSSVPVIGSLASGAAGNVAASMDMANNNAMQGIRTGSANAANNAGQSNAGYVRDTNKNLADYAARGDYQNSIAGINAKLRDAQLIPASTSGQVGGDAFNIVNDIVMVSMRVKMIDQAHMRSVGEYLLRYGYPVHQFATPPVSLQAMSKFTYWKMQETYISASGIPEGHKQIIRGIFEKGVTVWADPAYIGVTDVADNDPLGGITL